jgi:hypothetical protein
MKEWFLLAPFVIIWARALPHSIRKLKQATLTTRKSTELLQMVNDGDSSSYLKSRTWNYIDCRSWLWTQFILLYHDKRHGVHWFLITNKNCWRHHSPSIMADWLPVGVRVVKNVACLSFLLLPSLTYTYKNIKNTGKPEYSSSGVLMRIPSVVINSLIIFGSVWLSLQFLITCLQYSWAQYRKQLEALYIAKIFWTMIAISVLREISLRVSSFKTS